MLKQFLDKWELPIYTLSAGFIIGASIISFSNRDSKTILGMGGSVAATVAISYAVSKQFDPSAKHLETIASLKTELATMERNRDNAIVESQTGLKQLRQVESTCQQLEAANRELQQNLSNLAQNAPRTAETHQKVVSELTNQIQALQANLAAVRSESAQKILELENELNEYDRRFDADLNDQASKQVQAFKRNQLERIFNDFAPTTDEAIAISEEYDRIAHTYFEIASGSQRKLQEICDHYNARILAFQDAHTKAIEACSEEIELYKEKIALLQQQNRGILLEPVRRDAGRSESGRVSDAIVRCAYEKFRLALKMENWTELDDGFCKLGFSASSNVNLDAVIGELNQNGEIIKEYCFGYEKPKFKRSELFNGIECSFQLRKKTRKADLSSILRSSNDLLKNLRDNRPFMRFIAEPGGGKTPTVAIVVSEILKHGYASDTGSKVTLVNVNYCDPLEGTSVKNTNPLKFVNCFSDYTEAFRALEDEVKFRGDAANFDYTSETAYLWICDEYDEAIALDQNRAKTIRSVSKNGTHRNIGVISMSQTDQILQLKMNVSDLKMWRTLLLDEASIRSFLTNYGEKTIGDKQTVKLLENLEEILEEHKGVNDRIADTARQFRFCLMIDGKYSAFYQLPYFDSVDFDKQIYTESQKRIAQIRAQKSANLTHDSAINAQNPDSTVTQSTPQSPYVGCDCPKCGNGLLQLGRKDRGIQYYICDNCKKSTSEKVLTR